MKSLASDRAAVNANQSGIIARQLTGLRRFVSDFFERQALRQKLADLERSGSLEPVLRDLGLTLPEMERIVRGGPEAGRLLPAMAARLGIDIEALDPRVQYALRQTCAMCQAHRQCRRWLACANAERGGYKSFCPNADLFAAATKPQQQV